MKRNLKIRRQKKQINFLQQWQNLQQNSVVESSESEENNQQKQFSSKRIKNKKINNEFDKAGKYSFNLQQAIDDEFGNSNEFQFNNYLNQVKTQRKKLNLKICLHCLLNQMDLSCVSCQLQLCNNCYKLHQYVCQVIQKNNCNFFVIKTLNQLSKS